MAIPSSSLHRKDEPATTLAVVGHRHIITGARHAVLVLASIFFFGPFIWMVLTGFKSATAAAAYPPTFLPHVWHFSNFIKVFTVAPFGLFYFNSFLTSALMTLGQVVFSSLAGYAFARLRFPGRNAIFLILLSALIVPFQAVFVPLVHLLRDFGWLNSYEGLIIPGIPSIFGAFLYRQFFLSFPVELEDAARVDGCGVLRRFTLVVLPLAKSVTAAFGILAFLFDWNNFFYQFVIVDTTQYMTVQLGLVLFQAQQYTATEFNLLMAASTVSIVPLLIVFVLLQKYVVRGVMLGGLR
jgi:multiple sugar transport system permease protein/sn-glycerol 3-phosphate transport system permease protein